MRPSRFLRRLAVAGHRRPFLAAVAAYGAVSAAIWLLAGMLVAWARMAS